MGFPRWFIRDLCVAPLGPFKLRSPKLGLSLQFEERKQSGRRPTTPGLSKDLQRMLAKSIEEALDSLGGNAGQVILYHIEKEYSLKVDDMIESPDSFVEALQDMFGLGAFTLEQIVVETVLRNMPVLRNGLRTRRFRRLVTSLKQKPETCAALE